MSCKLCEERIKDWEGSDSKCAFKTGFFSSDSWNCATMNMLRAIGEKTIQYNNDQACCTLHGVGSDFVVLSWYKRRGQTEVAVMLNDKDINSLSLEEAERIVELYKNKEYEE